MLTEAHRSVLRDFPTLVWYCGPDEPELTWVNDTWLAFAGRTLAEESGFGFLERVHPDDRHDVVELFLDHYRRRDPYQTEYRARRHDGVYRWMHELGRPLHAPDGRFAGYFGACYDVTDRRDAVAELEASEAMNGLLMQTVFHDLAGPLGAASAAVDLLRRRLADPDDAETESLLTLLDQQHARMHDLLVELRHLDQAEHGEQDDRLVRVRIAEMLDDLLAGIDPSPRTVDRQLTDLQLEVDTTLLCRALDNLLRNAVEHTPPTATVWVRTDLVGGRPRITIEDDGPGLPHDRPLLFEPYQRSDRNGSTGLGLSIARRYVEAIDGSVTASQRPGGGARFVIELPASALLARA
jgi:PAS domain S-box-containing protein